MSEKVSNETMTFTFGDAGENHVGMEMIGKIGDIGSGFNKDDLLISKKKLESNGFTCELIHLNNLYKNSESIDDNIKSSIQDAYVLVIRNAINYFIEKDNGRQLIYNEMNKFEWDRKYKCHRRNKVLNKHARANVCFDNFSQEPDYENNKGRVVGYEEVPYLNTVRRKLVDVFGEKANNMICEGNRYFDIKKCGIGWHGDKERRKVIALRIGATIPLKYQWFHKSKSIGDIFSIELNDGDMYVMSEKAVGYDWMLSSKYTLRHCAGCDKYTKPK